MKFTIPIKLASLANLREHHMVRARRAKAQRQAACLMMKPHPVPCVITITRVGPRPLDSDNLAISAKHVRDGIADRLGVDDGSPLLTWTYAQRKAKEYGVEIEVTPSLASGDKPQ